MRMIVIAILIVIVGVLFMKFNKVSADLAYCQVDKRIKEYHIARYCS